MNGLPQSAVIVGATFAFAALTLSASTPAYRPASCPPAPGVIRYLYVVEPVPILPASNWEWPLAERAIAAPEVEPDRPAVAATEEKPAVERPAHRWRRHRHRR